MDLDPVLGLLSGVEDIVTQAGTCCTGVLEAQGGMDVDSTGGETGGSL